MGGWNPRGTLDRLQLAVAFAPNFPSFFREPVLDGVREWGKAVDLQISLSTDLSGDKTIAVQWKPLERSRLAQCYYPASMVPEPIAGDMTFNSSSEWISSRIFEIAVHEAGHALGLGHSEDRDAVMYPYYTPSGRTGTLLSADDIYGVMRLYRTHPFPGFRAAGALAP